jgi:linearmycin/streptolysin S transport system permease protein
MIRTLIRIGWLGLVRDRLALVLTFVMPIVFFSIFAMIFGSMSFGGGSGGGGESGTLVILVDEDGTGTSRRFAKAVGDLDAVRPITEWTVVHDDATQETRPHTRDTARRTIIEGRAAAAVVIPEGFEEAFGKFDSAVAPVTVIYDSANPIAQMALPGLMQAAAMQAAPDLLMKRGLGALDEFGGGITPEQRAAIDRITPFLRGEREWSELETDGAGGAKAPGFQGLVQVESEPARKADEGEETSGGASMISYYAAGISVMFLLFAMAGAGGAILAEEEYGTLERLMCSNVPMGALLLSNWLFFSVIGIAQILVMFVWAAIAFGLDLFAAQTLLGFGVMTLLTASAAAAFGILLATLCRSRTQLGGMSTIIILIMSALGGSMVPRFVAPDVFEFTSRFTFNGWALDGYLAVFWHAGPGRTLAEMLGQIAPSAGVLAGMTIVFMIAARLLARRWETV